MRTFLAPLVLIASVISAHAQLNPLPALSTDDGAVINPASPLQSHWASSLLFQYREGDGNTFTTPSSGSSDVYGRNWTTSKPDFSALNSGGTVREIFLGPGDSSWLPAVGYTYSTTPSSAGSYTLDYPNLSYSPSSLAFGDVADITLPPGQISSFDLWVDTTSNAYTLLNLANSQSGAGATAQILWTQAPLLVSTFIPSLGAFEDVDTWIASVVETPTNGAPQEFRFAIQEFLVSGEAFNPVPGTPIPSTPVPEASTYGLLGALALGLLGLNRKCRR